MANNRRKSAAIALAVVGIAGLSLASAATLDLTGGTLQAGTTVVATCQTTGPVAVGFDAPLFALGEYTVASVELSDIDGACDGKSVSVTLLDDTGAAIDASVTSTIAVPATSIAIPATSAADIAGVAVVIND